jgi:hypothetical protein
VNVVARSQARLQWDPDHDPSGTPTSRRALQVGLRRATLARYARDWTVEIEDISDFLEEERVRTHPPYVDLITPADNVYPVTDPSIAARMGVDPPLDTL